MKAHFETLGCAKTRYDWEDWGWWFGSERGQLGIYCLNYPEDQPKDYAIANMVKPTIFSFRHLKKINNPRHLALNETLERILQEDEDITVLGRGNEFPL